VKVVIVDYGMGNVRSVVSALKFLNVTDIIISSDEKDLNKANKLILPGVGAFDSAMEMIKARGLDVALGEQVIQRKKPVLGICLGMQLLGISSDEGGATEGLGFVDGSVGVFNDEDVTIPHMGFNQVTPKSSSKLYKGMGHGLDFYFVHSHKMVSNSDIGQSYCDYSGNFVASFERGNIAGTQFHPELSKKNGLDVLKNFLELF
jgi:imidazole glycerol-phosphate synthase subunit HisH